MGLGQRLNETFETAASDSNPEIAELLASIEYKVRDQSSDVVGDNSASTRIGNGKSGVSGYLKSTRNGQSLGDGRHIFTISDEGAGAVFLKFDGTDLTDQKNREILRAIRANCEGSTILNQSGQIMLKEKDVMTALICWQNIVDPKHEFNIGPQTAPEAEING